MIDPAIAACCIGYFEAWFEVANRVITRLNRAIQQAPERAQNIFRMC